ncbi:PepSY-like domain-containing protein [Bacteroidota bacterium]
MKLFILLLSTLIFIGCSSNEEIPGVVSKAFEAKYPDIKIVEWEIEGDIYEAEYTIDGIKNEAEFDKDGNLVATEYEIKIEELPEVILEKLKTEYAGYEIEEAEFVNSTELGELYEVELEKGDKEIDVYFDKTGNIIKTETEEEDEDDDDEDD